MTYRIKKYNSSLSATPHWAWKIQFKRSRLWRDVRNVQGVKVFHHPQHAQNYLNLIQKTAPCTTA